MGIEIGLHILGDLCNGTDEEMMVNAPFIKPEDPRPATARATISIFEDVAMPQRSDPNSKMKKNTRNVHCNSVKSRSFLNIEGELPSI
jgi:hypothetical protein